MTLYLGWIRIEAWLTDFSFLFVSDELFLKQALPDSWPLAADAVFQGQRRSDSRSAATQRRLESAQRWHQTQVRRRQRRPHQETIRLNDRTNSPDLRVDSSSPSIRH